MSSSKNATVTSYFESKDGEPHLSRTKNSIENIAQDSLANQNKSKGKRRLSASPAPHPSKRQDTKPAPLKPLSYKDLPTNYTPAPSQPSSRTLILTHRTGSLFAAPPHTLLLHACNTQGSWGSGIALAFKQQYPKAHAIYHAFCTKEHSFKTGNPVPVGTTLLIPPVDGNAGHWIGCLFTSRRYGKGKDGPGEILRNTGKAVEACLELVRLVGEDGEGIRGIRMCRINSGKFGVPWERTESVLKGIGVREGWMGSVEVWNPDGA